MGDPLPYQLQDARAAEQYAKWRLMELTSPPSQAHMHDHHSSSGEEFNPRPGAVLNYESPSPKFPVQEQNGAQLHHLQPSAPLHHHGYADSPAHPQGQMPQNGANQMVSKPAPLPPTVTDQTVYVELDCTGLLCTHCHGNRLYTQHCILFATVKSTKLELGRLTFHSTPKQVVSQTCAHSACLANALCLSLCCCKDVAILNTSTGMQSSPCRKL